MKQHGHLTPLQLNTLNHSTMQAVHTGTLHGSSRGWCKIVRHMGYCSCSRIAGLLELASKWSSSKHSVGGAIARMSAMIFCGLCLARGPQDGDVLALGGFRVTDLNVIKKKVITNNVYCMCIVLCIYSPHNQLQCAASTQKGCACKWCVLLILCYM